MEVNHFKKFIKGVTDLMENGLFEEEIVVWH